MVKVHGSYNITLSGGGGFTFPWFDEETKTAADDYLLALLDASTQWPQYERRVQIETWKAS